MPDKKRTCTIIGARLVRLPRDLDILKLLSRLDVEIRKSIHTGHWAFQTGMSMGPDIWAAKIVLKLKREFPGIRLICCLPCETQAERWPTAWREKYLDTLALADEVICPQTNHTSGCAKLRNCQMIDSSHRLIAVHDEKFEGFISHTVKYAEARGLDIVSINPLCCRKA